MLELRTSIEIDAPAEVVWKHLTNFARYQEWNPFLRRASGVLAVGSRLTVHAEPSGAGGSTFQPTVLRVEPNRELRWVGRMLFPGVLDGDHLFRIEPLGPERVRLVHDEEFTGLLVPFHRILRFSHTRRGFLEMNEALKRRAEADRISSTGTL